jgi:hypothetical protein
MAHDMLPHELYSESSRHNALPKVGLYSVRHSVCLCPARLERTRQSRHNKSKHIPQKNTMGREGMYNRMVPPTAEVVGFIDDAETPVLDSHGTLAMEKERVDHVLRLIYVDDGIPDATGVATVDSDTSLRRLRLSSAHDIATLGLPSLLQCLPYSGDPDVIIARGRLIAIHKYLTNGKNSFTTKTTMEMIVRANQDNDANFLSTLAFVVIFFFFFLAVVVISTYPS